MRILTIARELGPGGTERAAQNCTQAYRRAGHDVAVLGLDKGGSRALALQSQGIPVWIGGYQAHEIDAAVARASDWQPDLVHIHRPGSCDPRTADVLRRIKAASAGRRVAVIETNHFSRSDRTDDRLLVDVHMHMSKWCLWKWQQWSRGLRPQPVGVVLPHMIDVSAFVGRSDAANGTSGSDGTADLRRARRMAMGIPDGAFAFGRIGQPFPTGWSPIIFDAFERVAGSHPQAVLVVIGLPESLRQRVNALPAGIRSRVIECPFLNSDTELAEAYAALDCFLHAKEIGESFGYVLIESMLCGTPVITLSTPTRDNSQVEVIGHEIGGLVVADLPNMIDAMSRMITDRTMCRRLGAAGAQSVRERFATDVVAPKLLRLAELAMAQGERESLRSALEHEGLITSVPTQEIDALMNNVLGRTSLRARLIKRLAHRPGFYGAFVRIKKAWGGRS